MILVEGTFDGKKYTEPFSKGVLSRSLTRAEVGITKAYDIAITIEKKLIKNNTKKITRKKLVEYIIKELQNEDPEIAEKYMTWRKIKQRKDPLILLIGGASGVGTSTVAFEIANRLGIKNMISTDMVREVMRKIISKELSPVIHESSYTAQNVLRIPPPLDYDPTISGYKSHIETINVGVEAVIERAITEGISVVIEGVHIVPGFIRQDLMDKENVIMFTLSLKDEEMHKGRLFSRCREAGTGRPLQRYLDNFDSIRKIQEYTIQQSKIYNIPIIENIVVIDTIYSMIKYITRKYGDL